MKSYYGYQLFAEHLADLAGSIVERYFRGEIKPEFKESSSPIVTIADREVEEKLRAEIEFEDPDSGIIGEEFGKKESQNNYTWVIDPIDGTIAFSCGKPVFATLIALLENDVPILGVIDQPITRERWIGVEGNPSTMNGDIIKASDLRELRRAKFSTTSPWMFEEPGARNFFNKLKESVHIMSFGGDAYQYGLCASGYVDIVAEKGLNLHDWAALAPVLKGSGAVITDWEGNELKPGGKVDVLVAGNADLHSTVLQMLKRSYSE